MRRADFISNVCQQTYQNSVKPIYLSSLRNPPPLDREAWRPAAHGLREKELDVRLMVWALCTKQGESSRLGWLDIACFDASVAGGRERLTLSFPCL